jgi:acetyl-CoA carboxylase biotin carboxyl carrier protein
MEREGFKIKLKRGPNGQAGTGAYEDAQPMGYAPLPVVLSQGAAPVPPPSAPASNEVEIKSPMIGTLYRAPSPEAAPYVEVGTEVTPETVVCIIEAMKVMNEIKAEARGVITQSLVENAKPVEFGKPLFKLRPT